MRILTLLRVAIVVSVVLECFLHTRPALSQQGVSETRVQFKYEVIEDRRKSSSAYVTTVLETPTNTAGSLHSTRLPTGTCWLVVRARQHQ